MDAVLHYAQDVAPLLERSLPEAHFRAIGSEPTGEMKALASSRLVIEGFVENLQPVLGSARIMLVPLRYGAGLKGKIITAMAHGLPVVTTSVGAEGMALVDGEHVLVADTPDAMARAVERLYKDEALWTRLQRNGLAFVAATTSRTAGLGITRQILSLCGLPSLPALSKPTADASFHSPAGTPAALHDRQALATASRHARPSNADGPVTLVLPDGIAPNRLTGEGAAGVMLRSLADLATVMQGPWALLLDAFDDAGADAVLASLCARFPSTRPPVILFLPPRMESSRNGIRLVHALSGEDLREAQALAPAHLRHAARLASAFGAVTWQADTSILGYASLPIAVTSA